MKNIKNTFYLFFLIALLWGTAINCSNAQNQPIEDLLKKTEQSLDELKTVTFKINRSEKPFTSRDTLYRSAICSIYAQSNDKIGMHFISNIKTETDTLYHRVYNEKNFSMLSLYIDNSMKIKSFQNVNMQQNNIEDYFDSSFVLPHIFGSNERFTEFRKESHQDDIKEMIVKEEFYHHTPVYILTISFKNHNDTENYVSNAVDKYYIRKKDYLPIAYSTYCEFQGMKEYVFATIEYLSKNTLTSKDFIPYIKAEDANTQAIYEQTKSLFGNDSFPNLKNRITKKKTPQKIVDVKIVNNKLPFNELTDNNSKTIKLSELKGKVVLLDFWYRGCLPCLKSIPELIKLQEKYKNNLVVIGINDRDEREDVTEFLKFKKANYFSTFKNEINISGSLKISSFPTMIIINKKGEIAETKIGYDDKNTLTETINKLILN